MDEDVITAVVTDLTVSIYLERFLDLHKMIISDIQQRKKWNVAEFCHPRCPEVIGEWKQDPYQKNLKIEDCPIKFPGSELRVPDFVPSVYQSLLDMILTYDQALFPDSYPSMYVYLTITQSHVGPGKVQRVPGWHVDGYQKAHERTPLEIQHQYAITNCLPTSFHLSGLDIKQLPKKMFFETLARTCKDEWAAQPYEIHLLNSFCPHRPVEAKTEHDRWFVRLSFSQVPFTRKGNTINPLFDYTWDHKTKKEFYRG